MRGIFKDLDRATDALGNVNVNFYVFVLFLMVLQLFVLKTLMSIATAASSSSSEGDSVASEYEEDVYYEELSNPRSLELRRRRAFTEMMIEMNEDL